MRAKEFIFEAAPKQLGRAFNHLEDLVFFYGSAGTIEALEHLKDFNTDQGSASIRMKWDGCLHEDTLVLTSNGEIRIKELVDNPSLLSNIKAVGMDTESGEITETEIFQGQKTKGVKPWVEVLLENGSKILLTEDHKVYTTNRGWVAAGELTEEDDIQEKDL